MRPFQIEIVIGTINVSGDRNDRVEFVLLPIRKRLNVKQTFRQRIRRAFHLGKPIPVLRLFLWHGDGLGISTTGTRAHDFLHARFHRVMDRQRTHHQIVVKKPSGMRLVRADTPNEAGQMEDDGRFHLRIEGLHLAFFFQVPGIAADGIDVVDIGCSELFNHMTAEKTATAGHHDLFLRQFQHHETPLSRVSASRSIHTEQSCCPSFQIAPGFLSSPGVLRGHPLGSSDVRSAGKSRLRLHPGVFLREHLPVLR